MRLSTITTTMDRHYDDSDAAAAAYTQSVNTNTKATTSAATPDGRGEMKRLCRVDDAVFSWQFRATGHCAHVRNSFNSTH